MHFFSRYYFDLIVCCGSRKLFVLGTIHPIYKGGHDEIIRYTLNT